MFRDHHGTATWAAAFFRRTAAAAMLALSLLSLLLAASVRADENPASRVLDAEDGSWSVDSLGGGVYVFRWWPGFYVSPFLVGEDEVLAVDPINRDVAALYKEAIAAVTDAPVTKIVYSHDHRDHIVGADVLAPNADIYAHPVTLATLEWRGDADVPTPTRLVDDGDIIEVGDRAVSVHYFGPNHGRSNIALVFDTGSGRMLAWVDTLEVDIVPYRSLPDTNFTGYLESLRRASAMAAAENVAWVLGGHSGPGPAVWIDNYLAYFEDLRRALSAAAKKVPPPLATTVDEVIDAIERHSNAVIGIAVEDLRPKYGHWSGFDAWAPMNAQTVWMAMNIGA